MRHTHLHSAMMCEGKCREQLGQFLSAVMPQIEQRAKAKEKGENEEKEEEKEEKENEKTTADQIEDMFQQVTVEDGEDTDAE